MADDLTPEERLLRAIFGSDHEEQPPSDCVVPWFGGVTKDHLYDDCPSRKRGLPELERVGWDRLGGDAIDPHGTDVCGLCLHRHNRKEHADA